MRKGQQKLSFTHVWQSDERGRKRPKYFRKKTIKEQGKLKVKPCVETSKVTEHGFVYELVDE